MRATRGLRPAEAAREVERSALPALRRGPSNALAVARAGGEPKNLQNLDDIAANLARSSSPRVAEAAAGARNPLTLARASYGTAIAVDGADKGPGSSDLWPGQPSWGAYDGAKQWSTREVGSTW